MILKIKIIVRNSIDPKKFIGDFLKINLKSLLSLKVKKLTYRRRYKKQFTTLKSPHVHKDAQTSFELVSYCFTVKLKSSQISKFLCYYKKFLCKFVPNIKVKIAFKIPKYKPLSEKRVLVKYLKKIPTKNSLFLPTYLTELGFFGKISFSV